MMAQSNIQQWDGVEEKTIIPGFRARFVHSANMTFALWDIDAGALLPEHAHPHEQVSHLLEGEFELTVDGATRVMKAEGIAVIASHAVHSGRAITPCRILDAFYPLREDYMTEIPTVLQKAARRAEG